MLTYRANDIVGQFISLINPAADFADVAFLSVGFGLRLYVLQIIIIRHRFSIRDNARLGYRANKHSVRSEVDVLLYLEEISELIYLSRRTSPLSLLKGVTPSNLSAFRPLLNPKFSNTEKGASTDRQLTFIFPLCLIT